MSCHFCATAIPIRHQYTKLDSGLIEQWLLKRLQRQLHKSQLPQSVAKQLVTLTSCIHLSVDKKFTCYNFSIYVAGTVTGWMQYTTIKTHLFLIFKITLVCLTLKFCMDNENLQQVMVKPSNLRLRTFHEIEDNFPVTKHVIYWILLLWPHNYPVTTESYTNLWWLATLVGHLFDGNNFFCLHILSLKYMNMFLVLKVPNDTAQHTTQG